MSFTSITKQHAAAIDALTEEHRHAAMWLPFEAVRIARFLTESEAREAAALIEDLRAASNDNERAARLKASLEVSAKIVLKLLRLARIV